MSAYEYVARLPVTHQSIFIRVIGKPCFIQFDEVVGISEYE